MHLIDISSHAKTEVEIKVQDGGRTKVGQVFIREEEGKEKDSLLRAPRKGCIKVDLS